MPELSIFSKNLEPIAKNRLLELLSSLKIDDPNWIDENLWKKYRDAIPIVPAVTWPKLIDYFQNEKKLKYWRTTASSKRSYCCHGAKSG